VPFGRDFKNQQARGFRQIVPWQPLFDGFGKTIKSPKNLLRLNLHQVLCKAGLFLVYYERKSVKICRLNSPVQITSFEE
jgi:hypothetical protein